MKHFFRLSRWGVHRKILKRWLFFCSFEFLIMALPEHLGLRI